MKIISDKMIEGSNQFDTLSHVLAGDSCDCGYTVRTAYVRSKGSKAIYHTKVTRVHNPKA